MRGEKSPFPSECNRVSNEKFLADCLVASCRCVGVPSFNEQILLLKRQCCAGLRESAADRDEDGAKTAASPGSQRARWSAFARSRTRPVSVSCKFASDSVESMRVDLLRRVAPRLNNPTTQCLEALKKAIRSGQLSEAGRGVGENLNPHMLPQLMLGIRASSCFE